MRRQALPGNGLGPLKKQRKETVDPDYHRVYMLLKGHQLALGLLTEIAREQDTRIGQLEAEVTMLKGIVLSQSDDEVLR